MTMFQGTIDQLKHRMELFIQTPFAVTPSIEPVSAESNCWTEYDSSITTGPVWVLGVHKTVASIMPKHKTFSVLFYYAPKDTKVHPHYHNEHLERHMVLFGGAKVKRNKTERILNPCNGVTFYPNDIHSVTYTSDTLVCAYYEPHL